MNTESNKRLTYTKMRAMSIKDKFERINPHMREADTIDVINIALAVFSYICDEHIDVELEHGEIVQDIIDDKEYFVYNVNSLIYETRELNDILNEYIEKGIIKR